MAIMLSYSDRGRRYRQDHSHRPKRYSVQTGSLRFPERTHVPPDEAQFIRQNKIRQGLLVMPILVMPRLRGKIGANCCFQNLIYLLREASSIDI